MYKVVFFVPESHLENVKTAMFSVGAGLIGNYDCCAWQIKGEGQFRALEGSQAFIGKLNQLEKVEEFRVELVCPEMHIKAAIQALIEAHPYETPAFEVLKMIDVFSS
ncbi:NGG1p interacting factor NIF3 [Thiomicrorhabdus lithotrophica]|uniref:NGG1p interacting factor NIF3 n=1 Tax=Thiomicrorhabdus lithotrophica TaxID=2949997 RepID=A0ABY8CGY0_9GAMM|nr:NGG1p interacting factor NIF3 [Thiomicrorhabdus lithotrophica]WEJ63408.1 NGG1p interacting factor NIF3 [Thiomicrorhabdus lithotrophica]